MIFDVYQVIGWLGLILIVLAYFLLTTKKIHSHSLIYNIIVLLGSLGVVISTFATQSWPAMVLNAFMMAVAIYAIYKIKSVKYEYKELR